MPADPVRPPSALTRYRIDANFSDGESPFTPEILNGQAAVYLASEVDAALAEIAEEVKAHGEALRRIEALAEHARIREADLRAEVARLTRAMPLPAKEMS